MGENTKPVEDFFGQHIYRAPLPDGRIYSDYQDVVDVAPLMFERFMFELGHLVRERGKLPDVFLVPGRGAYAFFYALYPHFRSFADTNGLEPPRFIPFIATSYQAENTAEKTKLIGLDHYIKNGMLHDNMWAVIVEDLVDRGTTISGFDEFLRNHGLDITWHVLTDSVKVPRFYDRFPELKERVVYVRKITAGNEPSRADWKIQGHELADVGADEMLLQIRNKGLGLYDLICGDKIGWGLENSRGIFKPNDLLAAGFALGRMYVKVYGNVPNIVYAIWPDHHFDELNIAPSVPAVPFNEYCRALPKINEALGAEKVGRAPNTKVKNNTVDFGLITKGLGADFSLQSRKPESWETAVVVANEIPKTLPKHKLFEMLGTQNVRTVSLFYTPDREKPDLYALARF